MGLNGFIGVILGYIGVRIPNVDPMINGYVGVIVGVVEIRWKLLLGFRVLG